MIGHEEHMGTTTVGKDGVGSGTMEYNGEIGSCSLEANKGIGQSASILKYVNEIGHGSRDTKKGIGLSRSRGGRRRDRVLLVGDRGGDRA